MKKACAFILLLVLILCLSACGERGAGVSASSPVPDPTPDIQTEPSLPEAPASSAPQQTAPRRTPTPGPPEDPVIMPFQASSAPSGPAVLRVKVLETTDMGMLVYREDDPEYGLLTCSYPPDTAEDVRPSPGAVIDVTFSGMILEIYPGVIEKPEKLELVRQDPDLVGMYLNALEDLYETSPEWNEDTLFIGIDATGLHGLNDTESAGLARIFASRHGVHGESGEFEKMKKNEYPTLEAKLVSGSKGLLLRLEDTPQEDGSFSFSMEKWRDGHGTLAYTGCAARLTDGEWSYTLGETSVS